MDGRPVLNSDSEWIVEIEGRPVALLSHPKWAEMFWTSYEITPLTEDPEIVAKLNDVEFWRVCESLGVSFRHRASSVVASHAFPGMDPFPEPGRLVMRGMYITNPHESADLMGNHRDNTKANKTDAGA